MTIFGIGTRRNAVARDAPKISKGRRIYAIGDVHGCVTLLAKLLKKIEQDHDARGGVGAELVFMGDLIDRGEDSARLLLALQRHPINRRCRVLRGNHEAMLSDALAGDHDAMDLWLQHGGVATLHSFGVPDSMIDHDDSGRMITIAREVIPQPLRRWLRQLPLCLRTGDYAFVHAGVRPGVPLRRQIAADILWIREPFLSSDANHGAVIVHGHSITAEVEILSNRIAVDTGAYRTGHLSVLGIEGRERWVIAT